MAKKLSYTTYGAYNWAINVKAGSFNWRTDNDAEEVQQTIYDRIVSEFWDCMELNALAHNTKIWAEGRSGGWLIFDLKTENEEGPTPEEYKSLEEFLKDAQEAYDYAHSDEAYQHHRKQYYMVKLESLAQELKTKREEFTALSNYALVQGLVDKEFVRNQIIVTVA